MPPLTAAEQKLVKEAFAKQKKFLNDENLDKKQASRKQQEALEAASKGSLTLQTVGEGFSTSKSALIKDFTNSALMGSFIAAREAFTQAKNSEDVGDIPYRSKRMQQAKEQVEQLGIFDIGFTLIERPLNTVYTKAIQAGLEAGALLGKKLQIHNESRERVDNRLRDGKIDIKRVS